MKQVIGKKIIEITISQLESIVADYTEVVIDLGTGDGKFAYLTAKENPSTFVVGIDADSKSLEEISHKAERKPDKGGLPNLIYLWSAAEDLPFELRSLADQVFINFPWGSLLRGMIHSEMEIMANVAMLLKDEGLLHVYTTYHQKYEPQIISAGNLPELSTELFTRSIAREYAGFDLHLEEVRILDESEKGELQTSWRKQILSQRDREVYYARFRKGGKPRQEKGEKEQLEYSFHCFGHPNILATHAKTIEFTKDSDLSERGDCILGVQADFALSELQKFAGRKVKVMLSVKDRNGNELQEIFRCKVNPDFDSDHELVMRKSGFNSDRTFGFGLDKGANKVDRELVKILQNGGVCEVNIISQ